MDVENQNTRLEVYAGLKELQLQKNWGWFLAIGILLILLGLIAIGTATTVTLASMLVFGTLLVAGGIVQGVNAFRTHRGTSFLINALEAIFYFVTGVFLIMHPTVGAITLTLLLSAFYIVSGIFKLVVAFTKHYAHWGWLAFSGVVSLLLGLLIWAQWPVSGLWIIGLFIGIDLIIMGWLWVAFALDAKKEY